MAFVFLFYGAAFFILGVAISIYSKKDSAFRLAKDLWLIGAFGILHGMNAWTDMFILIQKPEKFLFLKDIRALVMSLSFVFLIQFGVKVITESKKGFGWLKGLAFVLPIAWACIFAMTKERFLYGDIWARYLLGFPGAMLTAWGLVLQLPDFKDIKFAPVKKYLKIAAVSFAFYAIFSGIITPTAGFFPASSLNYPWFLGAFGFPVQVLRGLLAAIIAISLSRALAVFDWESKEILRNLVQSIKKANEELEISKKELQAKNEELKELQENLIQSEKMSTVGRLSAGIAHEINNPLAVISGETELLLRYKEMDEDTRKAMEIIVGQSQRIKMITERLAAFSSKKVFNKPISLNINDALEKSVALLGYQIDMHSVKVVKQLDPDLPEVSGDTTQLQEVFLNIMLNAVQAMRAGGELTIKSRIDRIKEKARRKSDVFKQGQTVVVIEFKDTGKGIDEKTAGKLFDPFFTTGEKNTGLGLSICYGIIGSHKGVIEVHSKLREGTTIIVKLPVYKKEGEQSG